MLVPNQRDWVVGEIVTAAMLNSNVRDAVDFLLDPPMCDLYQAAAQSIPNGALTALVWDTEVYDNDSAHSTVTNSSRITIQTPGWYHVSAAYSMDLNTTGYRLVCLYKNGSVAKTGNRIAPSSNQTAAVLDAYLSVSAGDYLEIVVLQSSGAALSTWVANAFRSFCTARWVST